MDNHLRCPLCAQPADLHCRRCRAHIERNQRGEADRATTPHPTNPDRHIVIYQRRQNASLDDGSQRTAKLHQTTADRHAPLMEALDKFTSYDPNRRFGRLHLGKGHPT